MNAVTQAPSHPPQWIGERALSKLRWRCRRGLLENDLFIARFFQRHADTMTEFQAQGLTELMDLSDNDLLDLLLHRTPVPDGASASFIAVLELLRTVSPPTPSVSIPVQD